MDVLIIILFTEELNNGIAFVIDWTMTKHDPFSVSHFLKTIIDFFLRTIKFISYDVF